MLLIDLVITLLLVTTAGPPNTAALLLPIDVRFAKWYPPTINFNLQRKDILKDTGLAFLDHAISTSEIASWKELNVMLVTPALGNSILSTIEKVNLVIGNVYIPYIRQCQEVNDIGPDWRTRPYCLSEIALEQLKEKLLNPTQEQSQWWIVNNNNGDAVSLIRSAFLKKLYKGTNLPDRARADPRCHASQQEPAVPRATSLQEQIDQGCLEQIQTFHDIWPRDWPSSNIPVSVSIHQRNGNAPIPLHQTRLSVRLALTASPASQTNTKRSIRGQSRRYTASDTAVLSPWHLAIDDLPQISEQRELWHQNVPSRHDNSPMPDLPRWGRKKPRVTTQIIPDSQKDSFSSVNGPNHQQDSIIATGINLGRSPRALSSHGSVQDYSHHYDGPFDWYEDYAEANPHL